MQLASNYCNALASRKQRLCDSMHEALGKPLIDNACARIALNLHNQLYGALTDYNKRDMRKRNRNAWGRQLSSAEVKPDLMPSDGRVHSSSFWISMGALRDAVNLRVLRAVGS